MKTLPISTILRLGSVATLSCACAAPDAPAGNLSAVHGRASRVSRPYCLHRAGTTRRRLQTATGCEQINVEIVKRSVRYGQVRGVAQTLDRRENDRLAQPVPPPGKRLGVPEPKRPGIFLRWASVRLMVRKLCQSSK
jgi:hypothetical protein